MPRRLLGAVARPASTAARTPFARWSRRFRPTPAEAWTTRRPCCLSSSGGPIPESRSSLRRVDRARGEHHLLGRVGLLLVPGSAQEVGDAPRPAALDEQPRGARAREHRQVGPVQGRAQVAVDDAEAPAAPHRDRGEPGARVVGAVEIGRAGDPRGGRGLEEVQREGTRAAAGRARGKCLSLRAYAPATSSQPQPAGQASWSARFPRIAIIALIEADPPSTLPRGKTDPAAVERVLRDGVVAPVERGPEELRERRGDAHVAASGRAGLPRAAARSYPGPRSTVSRARSRRNPHRRPRRRARGQA